MEERALREHLLHGQVIPAHPLAVDESRRLDECCQRALTRYYVAAGAGGIAVGVHTTQFEIRDRQIGLYRPVLELAAETADHALDADPRPFVKVAGLVGRTAQAVAEARTALELGYDAGLLSLGGWTGKGVQEADLVQHCREVAAVIPLFGFYLQPAVGGRALSRDFWRRFAEIERVVAIKIAPFDRYRTWDVVRAVGEAERRDIALYTGNDDSILVDLLTPYPVIADRGVSGQSHIVGGLLGQWAVWTKRAVEMLAEIRSARASTGGGRSSFDWLRRAAALTDANGAIFDAAHRFAGCIPGIHEVLRRAGLMRGRWCLDPALDLSPGQAEEITRVLDAYPELQDQEFIDRHRDDWLR